MAGLQGSLRTSVLSLEIVGANDGQTGKEGGLVAVEVQSRGTIAEEVDGGVLRPRPGPEWQCSGSHDILARVAGVGWLSLAGLYLDWMKGSRASKSCVNPVSSA